MAFEMGAMVPQKYERHVSKIGGVSGGLGRGGHTRSLWGKIEIENVYSPGACWLWRGYLDKDGYGKITGRKGQTYRAHRWLWEQERNALNRGEVLVNLCGVARCINPAHKKLGTQGDAIRNCYEAGRHTAQPDNRGELSACAILTDDDVLFIRSQRAEYGLCPVLGKLFGVSPVTVSKIRARASWKHLGNGSVANAMPLKELREIAAQREQDRQRKNSKTEIDERAQSRDAA